MNGWHTLSHPNCFRCTAFFITHDPVFPYGCSAMGFRSRRLPCAEVQETSGEVCLAFKPRQDRAKR
jgi:hypothetical protein